MTLYMFGLVGIKSGQEKDAEVAVSMIPGVRTVTIRDGSTMVVDSDHTRNETAEKVSIELGKLHIIAAPR